MHGKKIENRLIHRPNDSSFFSRETVRKLFIFTFANSFIFSKEQLDPLNEKVYRKRDKRPRIEEYDKTVAK
jgi:hypothetical protein